MRQNKTFDDLQHSEDGSVNFKASLNQFDYCEEARYCAGCDRDNKCKSNVLFQWIPEVGGVYSYLWLEYDGDLWCPDTE
ncbi:MAG: hypothetical protein AAF483_06830 [Planctomycetota bacterium]